MYETEVPLLAYIYVGITSLVLAYVSYIDDIKVVSTPSLSNISLLPNVSSITPSFMDFSKSKEEEKNSGNTVVSSITSYLPTIPNIPIAQPLINTPEQSATKIGGKKRKTKIIKQKIRHNNSKKVKN